MTEEHRFADFPALEGYVNWSELRKILLVGVGQTSLIGFATMILILIAESAQNWYTGPAGPAVIFALTGLASFLRSKAMAKKFIAEGESR